LRPWITFALTTLVLAGCTTIIETKSIDVGGRTIHYVTGKVAGDGQEAIFRDAWMDGKPVLSDFRGGQSLVGQVLDGAAGSALIAGGMVGAASALRPTRINDNDVSNISNDSLSVSASQSSAEAKSHATNKNHVVTKIKDITNSGGGVPGCQKAKFGC
jgi:hypothetical protein